MKTKFDIILFYFVSFLVLFALGFSCNGIDNDVFSRLIQGSAVVNLHHPLYNDVFSYTPVNIWIDHEWLTSAVIYLAQLKAGFLGLIILKCVFMYLMFCATVFAVLKLNKNPYNFTLWFLYIVHIVNFQIIYADVKVQWVSFIFFPIWIFCLEKIKLNDKKYAFILPFLSLIWLNCHGGVVAGVGVLLIYIFAAIIEKKPLKLYFIALALVFITFFINPWGYKYIYFLFNALQYDKSSMSEWMNVFNPRIQSLNLVIYKGFLVFAFFWIIYKIRNIKIQKVDYSRILTLFITAVFSIFHIKHIQLFMCAFMIYCWDDFYKLFDYCLSVILKSNYKAITQNIKYVLYLPVVIYSIFLLCKVDYKTQVWEDAKSFFPVDCVNFLMQNNINARVLAPYTVSDYIAYKGYPKLKVFMNSRYEQLYPEEYIKKSLNFFNLDGVKPFEILFQYPPDIIILENTRPVLANPDVLYELGYTMIYRDDYYSAFVINHKRNFSYFYPNMLDISYFNNIFDTNFLNDKK